MAGYKPQTVTVHTEVSGGGAVGMAGNVVLGGVLGMAVDASDGSMNDFKPNPLKVTLDPDTSATSAPTATPAVAPPNNP